MIGKNDLSAEVVSCEMIKKDWVDMKYFGTDGIRGIPNETLSLELLLALSRALKKLNIKDIIVGTDTRWSKDMLAFQMIAGCLSVGLDVEYIGVISTPGLIYLSKIKNAVGIMITASHNPYQDNGIKILYQGRKLSIEEESLIEQAIKEKEVDRNILGKYTYNPLAIKEYHLMLSKSIVSTHLKIALDCANGATYKTAPLLFKLMTPYLEVMGNQPTGTNINENCGSTHLEALSNLVLERHCDIGIAFDGDGDRVQFIDKKGEIISGDHLLYILACYLKQKNKLKHNTVALTVMSNPGIVLALKEKGIETIETPVGDRYVADAIRNQDLTLGGENSGHIIYSEQMIIGDGVFVAMKIIEILEETQTTIEDWTSQISLYPNQLENIYVQNKNAVLGKPLQQEISKMKEEAREACKIIVRPSGTEECIRISIMAKTKELVMMYMERVKALISALDA